MRVTLFFIYIFAVAIPACAASPSLRLPAHPVVQTEIDKMFSKLAKAGSAENAKPIEDQILAMFDQSGSASVDLLMTHAGAAAKAGDTSTAMQIVVTVTEIAPNYAEGWHERAAIAQSDKDDANALTYLQKTIALNPRQFEACLELGAILASYGDKKQALEYFRRAQTLDPFLDGIDKQVNDLSHQVEGDKI